ncbi:2-hydroxyacid dehydrogenase [Shimwellia blattae]|uniref:Putative D-isomer specific 2-hydroxyacid dehydrogenase family protein n=1 Tax=Shimwellia blattae (strain ATCC 29907 / DSM 4481 / JCM 1650 / NBRC 105725 / CDC 9005-74) TaxID=630626 RepID=I2BBD9_SHIBC|nr:2-hydroxyacid dehydrogenase [Shimwellia blattae]AFJ47843.1 putative D-isomer specific 2-hydroxyacid dehydrogenase family protein [Shimwellia blattae DSM 4481 = NBRC 105725]GAB79586.1 glyoxylate/hydroxypyruvate reductase B [Shimwellia blattae DSM 4481 = NBRC 105725]VDY65339.1 Glyoxylate/hydroxypyruvate reductase B [Shimwellia blattae]VEC24283.1 Glyoxylate/hydroxypyruvate reductase B [Shimwellia blattae]
MTSKLLQHGDLPAMLIQQLEDNWGLSNTDTVPPEAWGPFTCLITNGETRIDAALMDKLPALEHIAVFGVGYDQVDISAACARDIAVSHTPGVLTDDVADMAIGMMIACGRQIVGAQKFIEAGQWPNTRYPLTRGFSGARLGILGMGRIGEAIALRASVMNMTIGFFDPMARGTYAWQPYDTLAELASHSDFLMVCVPGGASTRGMVDSAILAALGPEGILINISRGSVVDEPALINALEQGVIAGAGLDVFACEPHVPAALQGCNNIVLTPHMASSTWQTREAMSGLVIDNVRAGLLGAPLITPVPESRRTLVQKVSPAG